METDGKISRRKFMAATAFAGLAADTARMLAQDPVVDSSAGLDTGASREVAAWKLLPFPMPQVRLLEGPFKRQMEINTGYLRMLPNNRLLHMFRVTAGLPSSAEPLGGKESPTCELRGHFSGGHYLSACALTYASTGDEPLRRKADALVAGLAECQKANGGGYLSAFPRSFFDRLRAGKPVWAPFYTLHKIMAGHLDMYTYCRNEQALRTLEGMGDWVGRWVAPLSEEHMQRVLEVEQGGILEVLCNLYAVTGKEKYLRAAFRFDHHAFFDPLAEYKDELTGLHANTNIPKVIGAARQYEVTGERRYSDIARYFWREVSGKRTFCSGGTGLDEHWRGRPGMLAGEVGQRMEECCCGYNMLKLTRHVFGLTADPHAMDYYERTLFNSRLGTQDARGMKGYFYALGRGWWKYYNTPFDSFWCCTGTGAEEFSKFNNTIYFHDRNGIYVNLFIPSEVNWPQKHLRLVQETQFPEEDRTTLTLHLKRPLALAVNIRVPYWAVNGGSVTINGKPVPAFSNPSSYLALVREWKDGDRVEVRMPMSLHTSPIPGDETQQAVLYGPLVLAGRLGGGEGLTRPMVYLGYSSNPPRDGIESNPILAESLTGTDWVEPVASGRLAFRTVGQKKNLSLVPLYKLAGERYTVYWKVKT